MPFERTKKLCTRVHHSERSFAAVIFVNGTYFVDTPYSIPKEKSQKLSNPKCNIQGYIKKFPN
jgi:hypothetical protein